MRKIKYFYEDDAREIGDLGGNKITNYLILKSKCWTDFAQTEAKMWHDLYQDCKRQFGQLQKCNINKERIKEKTDKVRDYFFGREDISYEDYNRIVEFVERLEKELEL